MIRVHEVKMTLSDTNYSRAIARRLKINEEEIVHFQMIKKALDARDKNDLFFIYHFNVELKNEKEFFYTNKDLKIVKIEEENEEVYLVSEDHSIAVIGSGPAGLFCALELVKAGVHVHLFERGEEVDKRVQSVQSFWDKGLLDSKTNVQFGEGGAGTFSDGKLTTGIKDKRCAKVLKILHQFGAKEDILYESKPHVGTDKLIQVVKGIREEIKRYGGKIYFNHQVVDIETDQNQLTALKVKNGDHEEVLSFTKAVFAIGHSARDTVRQLFSRHVAFIQKPFSLGVRIEHLQTEINRSQYGKFHSHPSLGSADYKLACHLPNGHSVYSFCMCPGGKVVASTSEEGKVVTNGMSYQSRNEKNANSALLVSVGPKDYPSSHPLSGIELQEQLEIAAFQVSKDYRAPVQLLGDFLEGRVSTSFRSVMPTYLPGVVFADLNTILPNSICESLKQGVQEFGKKIKAFRNHDAILTGVETRSSAPYQMVRDESFQSSIRGIYPIGEGAGYSGGIMSSAVDGLKIAQAILLELQNQ